MADAQVTHTESEDHPWTLNLAGPGGRADAHYGAAKKRMNALAAIAKPFGEPPYQDHHGGALWAFEQDDPDKGPPFMVRNILGIENCARYCTDPAQADKLRVNAQRFYSGFPRSAGALGLRDVLDTPITDFAGVSLFCDSLLNASVPLPQPLHTGVLPQAAGEHHYPDTIWAIQQIAYADFDPFPTTGIAVVPVAPRGSGDGRVMVAHSASKRHRPGAILPPSHPVAKKAFRKQLA